MRFQRFGNGLMLECDGDPLAALVALDIDPARHGRSKPRPGIRL